LIINLASVAGSFEADGYAAAQFKLYAPKENVMSELGFNRDDPEFASLIISGLCPTKLERSHLMSQLLLSCALAERIAPLSRAATLFKDGSGFRVNVGRVEVFTFISGSVRIMLFGAVPVLPAGKLVSTVYTSVPQPQSALSCSVKEFVSVDALVQEPHAAFVRSAALTSNGKPYNTSFARFHSAGLLAYARESTCGQVGT
jgi:hypothetical protein